MILYFSGTGNSKYAAHHLAHRLGDQAVDAFATIQAGERLSLTSETPWVIVAPTYAWRLPQFFEEALEAGDFQGSKEAYFVMTCGSDIGRPEDALKDLCQSLGLNFRGVLEVVMPENYVAMFPVPGEKESAEIVRAAHPTLDRGADAIGQGRDFPARKTSFLDRWKSSWINDGFYRFFVKAKKFQTTETCNGCGLCVKLCPLNNITLEGEKPQWGDHCTHCMACICRCPQEAVEYGRVSRGKYRYRCPDYDQGSLMGE